MSAYYNEIEPYAVEWLRNLIKEGLIADGEVDSRSIVDVRPSDLAGFTQCHFFAGIGGWSLGLRLAGWPDDRPVWTGSCPCQPFSAIGKGRGFDDERDLWPTFFDLIAKCRPATVFGEQVASEDALGWIDRVFLDLEREDYAVAAFDLCAACIDAPHIRQRLYWLGHTERAGLERHNRDGAVGGQAEAFGPDTATGGGGVEPAGVDAVPVLRGFPVHHPRSPRPRMRLPTVGRMANRPL